MIIDKIEYDDVFEKVEKIFLIEDIHCLVCDNKIKINEFYYRTFSINCLKNKNDYDPNQVTYICIKCKETPKEIEEVVISLLKIMYGGVIKVLRFVSSDCGHMFHYSDRIKDFYY